jgi:hypothetical protein
MELDCTIKSDLNEICSAVPVPIEVSGFRPTLRRAGNRIFRFFMALYLLGTSVATESTPLCWFLWRLFSLAKGCFLVLPEGSRQTTVAASRPARATAKDNLTARALVCPTPAMKNASFRNVWTPPETGSLFKQRRFLWTSHRPMFCPRRLEASRRDAIL